MEQATAAAVRGRLRRGARYARQAVREFAAAADSLDADLIATFRLTRPTEVEEAADIIRAALARGPVAVLVTQPTTAPEGGTGGTAS